MNKVKIKRKIIIYFLTTLCFTTVLKAIEPADHANLHCTQVYIQEEFRKDAKYYVLNLRDLKNGDKEIRIKNNLPAIWCYDLQWGHEYTWQINAFSADSLILKTGNWHHFKIVDITYQGFDEIRMKVNTNDSSKHAKGLLAIDYTRSIYNREGRPVWTIPFIEKRVGEATHIRDLKLTNENTLTFLTIPIPMEIDFDGNVIWEAPYPFVFKSDTIVYHHQFQRTSRGTYMVLGDKKVWRKMKYNYSDEDIKEEFEMKVMNDAVYKRVLIAILLEFNKKGELIWWWDANDYITDEDLVYKKNKRGLPLAVTHANAFGENEDGSKVYVGFRDLSRIVRIDKKTAKAEFSYGERYPSGEARVGDGLFKHQHDAKITKRQTFYILNNNGALSMEGISSVMELKVQPTSADSLVTWQFALDFDTLSKGKSLNGGNVNELPNGNVLVCGGALNRIIEVKKNQEVVWDAFLYARGKKDTLWQDMNQYRCSWLPAIPVYYFLVQPHLNEQAITIYNTGQMADSYLIEILDKDFKRKKTITSGLLTAGANKKIVVPKMKRSALLAVRVRSNTTGKIIDFEPGFFSKFR